MAENQCYSLGVDVGSTTAKAVLRNGEEILFEKYERHNSAVREKTAELLLEIKDKFGDLRLSFAISGSAGLGLAEDIGVPFVQEVYAEGETVKKKEPDANCVVELGGEDAKIIFFDGGTDERMNGSCAGGTGAFIDQMATLLDISVDELDRLSLNAERIYPIASRCGVFAKTDIQPLLNQGARKEDVAASIYKAVVNQTIAGLARGKKIQGKVLFLGGPLFYLKGLQKSFKETLALSDENAVFPPYARFSVAIGASYYAEKTGEKFSLSDLCDRVKNSKVSGVKALIAPLFKDEEEYSAFRERHGKDTVKKEDIKGYKGKVYIGIDCGSTTTKLAVIGEDKQLLYSYYGSNKGNPVEIVREKLIEIYDLLGDGCEIGGSAVTGYGEDLIKNAFDVDAGIVETIAHYTAAKFFRPNVDFILDIGGQDIKCFKIKDGAIDGIMLNEACSSGCGSFLETFAKALGYSIADFAKLGLFAKNPVNLGSRCTVFMNSSVKQAQKDGAGVDDISAGLSMSVVKNAIYKVIRVNSARELGENIVVQGGTFYNDAVLRAFERELGFDVIRPDIAGLMGAYGAAIYSMKTRECGLMGKSALQNFTHTARAVLCNGCTNRCHLTVNTFDGGRVSISGNSCEKPLVKNGAYHDLPDLYVDKRNFFANLTPKFDHDKNYKMGLPLALGNYELLPLWYGVFDRLGFDVEISPMSTRRIYELGQFTIPSDTACYPAKIMHGHMLKLIDSGCKGLFYPCLPYNVDEKRSDNHYNCPVVAYYSELLGGNVEELSAVDFYKPYLNINDKKQLAKELFGIFGKKFSLKLSEVKKAVEYGFGLLDSYYSFVRQRGEEAIEYARKNGKRILILAGRPYHVDSEICHNIDKLACSLGFVVVSEDSVCHLVKNKEINVKVLNQWTYHSRLYLAAEYAVENDDVEFCQLVSFGCGVDAITTDEVRRILEKGGKLYTQLKIDEITNLGSIRIRLRSLIGALDERKGR
ncbi:MAG: 2-hydroxyacyl-CoA dehydratase [Clostridia bacterium]|nr:2-hydroxyacyl-CoA dehydratase [Clostridia bacterium]